MLVFKDLIRPQASMTLASMHHFSSTILLYHFSLCFALSVLRHMSFCTRARGEKRVGLKLDNVFRYKQKLFSIESHRAQRGTAQLRVGHQRVRGSQGGRIPGNVTGIPTRTTERFNG